jgi:hypothetical protein
MCRSHNLPRKLFWFWRVTLFLVFKVTPREWWTMSVNQTQCEERNGCWEIYSEAVYPTIQYSFSPKSSQDCEYNHGNELPKIKSHISGTMKNYFTWEPAQWIPGTLHTLQWTPKAALPKYKWAPTIDYQKLQTAYVQSSVVLLALQSKSYALCKYSFNKETITTVACNSIENTDKSR